MSRAITLFERVESGDESYMVPHEFPEGFEWIGRPAVVSGEDFSYPATVLCSFPKSSGKIRYIVEDRGRLFIQREAQITYTDGPQPANPAQVTDARYDSVALEAAREIMTLTRSGTFDYHLKAKIQVRIIEAITAAIGAGGQAVAVKPLEWMVFCSNSGNCSANTALGEYVIQSEDELWIVYRPHEDAQHGKGHDTLEAAKAAAQADYERRVLSALSQPHPAAPTAMGERDVGTVTGRFVRRGCPHCGFHHPPDGTCAGPNINDDPLGR